MTTPTRRHRFARFLLWAAGSVILLLGMLFAEHSRSLELPTPTGPFTVGRLSAVWEDPGRLDPFAVSREQKRELVVWIWYPARPTAGAARAAYLPEPWSRALADHAGVLLTEFLSRDPSKIRAHSLEGVGLAPDRLTYPVIILRSGIGALALDYTTLAEDLASHGYIVVGADTPYSTTVVVLPDGRVIEKTTEGNPGDAPITEAERDRLLNALVTVWVADTTLLVDQLTRLNDDPSSAFTGRLDLGAIGVAGHSFGGATAAQFCHDDVRCRAGMDIDGAPYGSVVTEGLAPPFLFLLSDHGAEWRSPDCTICADIRAVATRIPGDRLIVTLRGAHHFSFSDEALVKSQMVMTVMRWVGLTGGLAPREGLVATARYAREFFDVHLRGASRAALYGGPLVPSARIETR